MNCVQKRHRKTVFKDIGKKRIKKNLATVLDGDREEWVADDRKNNILIWFDLDQYQKNDKVKKSLVNTWTWKKEGESCRQL